LSEVADFDSVVGCDEDVLRLDVAVSDAVVVHWVGVTVVEAEEHAAEQAAEDSVGQLRSKCAGENSGG